MKRLLLCRHAKSSWKDMTLADIDRPLNKRGKRDAPEMGRRLAEHGIRPDMIISSPARRARKTAAKLAKALGIGKNTISIRDEIYGAATDQFLDIIHSIEDNVSSVIMVGHNPEMTELANILGNLDVDNVVTCGVVAYDFKVSSWKQVGKGRGRLVFYDFPRREGLISSP
jgi:phosphohistidine phosphatase